MPSPWAGLSTFLPIPPTMASLCTRSGSAIATLVATTPIAFAVVCIVCVVARLNVYLPDELAAAAKGAGLNVSALTQDAVRRSLAARSTDLWLATLKPTTPHRVAHDRILEALDAVRDEPPTRHG